MLSYPHQLFFRYSNAKGEGEIEIDVLIFIIPGLFRTAP